MKIASTPARLVILQHLLCACILIAIVLLGCASTGSSTVLDEEEGIASFYASRFDGQRTASGERYDEEAMTAAHRSLPFGTMVRVINEENGRSVKVRINDRGPIVRGRIIDLSRAAARELRMIEEGIVPVRVQVLERGG